MGMRFKELLLVVCVAACGEVAKAPADAAPDTPDALVCSGAQMVCDNACVDLMGDRDHCGSCTHACAASEGCAAGTCIDETASCMSIKATNPLAGSGPYTHTADGTQFFCDMSKGVPVQYNALWMGKFTGTYPGKTIVNAAQLQDPVVQQAFIWLYNKQMGFHALEAWTAVNVCTSTAINTRLTFGGSLMFPYSGGTSGAYNTTATYIEDRVGTGGGIMTPPIPTSFFESFAPAEVTGQCSDGDNPGLYFETI